MRDSRSFPRRPLTHSLARFTSAATMLAALALAGSRQAEAQTTTTWQGNSTVNAGLPGDGFLWTNQNNWQGDVLPAFDASLLFGTGTVGTIILNGNQNAGALTFDQNFTLGTYGSSNILDNTSGSVSVAGGKLATINAIYNSSAGLNLTGGGTLYLTNPNNSLFTGQINITGPGTTLMANVGGLYPLVNGTGGVQPTTRSNAPVLGLLNAARVINLDSGGTFKMIGAGSNGDGNTYQFVLANGAGGIDVSSTYQQLVIDDANTISGFGDLVKSGKGRLSLLSQDYNLGGNVTINAGILDLNRLEAGGGAGTRFSSLAGTGTGASNTITVNAGGALMPNAGGGVLDQSMIIANDGSILATQGGDNEYGVRTGGTVLQVNGTTNVLSRDLFTVQTQRFLRINSDITGTGTLQLFGSTNSGGTPRVVIQRSSAASTFSGTFRLMENVALEANPRYNQPVDIGNMFAAGDIEFAGWGGQLDVRNSDPAAATLLDYTANDISVTSTQAGNLNRISINRSTVATGTGHAMNFGSLTIGNHRLALEGGNSYQVSFSKTSTVKGNAVIESRSAPLLFQNAVAITEDAAGRSLTLVKNGNGNSAAQDVISGGVINISNLEIATGTLQLRGANGAIGTALGGGAATITINGGDAVAGARGLPTFGVLNLDSNGSALGIAAANNNNRIADNAVINMRSNSVLRLTSANNAQTTETIGTINVSGHGLIDIAKTGTATAPVALTINSLNLTGTKPTVNFTGAGIGTAGTNTTRVIIGNQTATSFLGAQYHQGNEWAKYDTTVDSGFAIGVTPFQAADYQVDTAETAWAAGQHIKRSASGVTLTANRTADTLNLQFSTANQSVNTNGNVLALDKGGIIVGTNSAGIIGNNGAGGLTAGSAGPADLYVHNSGQLDIKLPVINNAGADGVYGTADDGVVNFVKSGTGTVRLTHHLLGVGVGNQGGSVAPFTASTWTSSMTGSWIINDGTLQVQRGQFLNGRPIVLNGGTLEINEPVASTNANSIIPNWGNNVIVNGNAMIGSDDNGESADAGVGGNTLVKFGSLTINNGSILGMGSFNNLDVAFMGGATFNGKGTINIGVNRSGANGAKIISGAVTGSGFDVVALGATPETLILGGTSSDTAPNTFTGAMTVYGGTVRLNKANGVNAIPDTPVSEDVVVNGGTLAWGAGHHGDLSTTNNVNTTNNGLNGLTPTSPAGALAAGQNQIADTATVTLLAGSLGEGDRINNEKWGTLIQKNGNLNVGLGKMEVDVATVTGGAFNMNPGGSFKAGTWNLNVGAYSPTITTGLPGDPTKMSTLEIGSGGLNMTGQNIIIGGGSNGSIAGAGAVLKLGGNVTAVDDPMLGNSGNQGIFIQIGNSFRELGNSKTDLLGGDRTFTIDEDVQFFVTTPITNGGIVKSGGGALILQPHQASDFAGAVTVNSGVLAARANNAFGTSAGGVTINSGGTVKLEGGWTYGDNFTVSGPGALIPGTTSAREVGALVSDNGRNRIQGTVTLGGDATIASSGVQNSSATPTTGAGFWQSDLALENAAGITGTGTLTLSGNGNGSIAGGLKTTAGGLNKEGSGRWIISGAGTYVGETVVSAGILQISNGAALGATTAGTTVYGGATLELVGGIAVNEPLTINDGGANGSLGSLSNLSGSNTYGGAITLGTNATISSASGNLAITGNVGTGAAPNNNRSLTLAGKGNGTVSGAITLGTGGITKNGAGSWTLAGGNTLTGATTINGGSLILDYSTNNTSKLSATAPLTLGGGKLVVQGNAGANTTQTIGGIVLMGGGTIQVESGAGRTATLNLGDITRPIDSFTGVPFGGGSVNFVLPQGGAITTTATLTNGILGGFATVGADWATKTAANIVPFTAYAPFDATGVTGANANSLLSTTQSLPLADFSTLTTNSLKIQTGANLMLGTSSIILSSGGLIYNGTGTTPTRITSSGGTISGATSNDELFIHTTGGVLDVGTALIGSGVGSFTKTGDGTLFLRNNGSSYTGTVTVNGGTLAINGLGGTHPTALGSQSGQRNVVLNGGTLRVVGGYDLNVSGGSQMQMVIGSSGGTIRQEYGGYYNDSNGGFWMNDLGQLSGSGDLTLAGGGRFRIDNNYSGFTGSVTVDGSVLRVNNVNSIGGRAEQTITLKSNSVLINEVGTNQQIAGLPNNIVMEGGAMLVAQEGNRAFLGDIQLSGTNTFALADRDNDAQQRDMHLMGRISGTGVTLEVIGASNANPLYLSNGANDFTGIVNLGNNTTLEARQNGSLGQTAGGVTVNLNGVNSRLLLRNWQNADYLANVVVNNTAEISADRLVNNAGGSGQLLSINNLTVNGGQILQFGGGNAYVPHVKGTATFNVSPIVNVTNNVLFENGMTFTASSGNTLDKRGNGALILRGPATHTGTTLIQAGVVDLRGANGSLPNTSKIELRGGELRVENSESVNTSRLNASASLELGGGTLRLNGDQTLPGKASAVAGNTVIVYNPGSEVVTSAISLGSAANPFTRAVGATLQFQTAENGGAVVGSTNLGNVRVSPRILIAGQANVTGNSVVPGMFGNNGFDFVQYDGTTMDGGQALGVREMRNPGNTLSPSNYVNDEAETGWTDTDIARLTGTTVTTLTANRALEAVKFEGGATPFRQIAFGNNTLRIETGGMITVGNETLLNSVDGKLTAGPATPGTGVAELFVHGNGGTVRIEPMIVNNGSQPVALVKSGTNTLQLRNTVNPSTFTGGVFLNGGTLDITRGGNLGPAANNIQLAGGVLNLNVPDPNTDVDLPNFGQSVSVVANATINLDNNGETAGTGSDNNIRMGKLTIDGPYTLAVRGFDGYDISFKDAALTNSPTIDLPQTNTGGNATTVSLVGNLSGTGFMVTSTGNTANTAAVLQLGDSIATVADNTPNTYTGKLVMVNTFPANQNQPTVQLNKASGTTAITGDVEINAGTLNWLADDQMADAGNIALNFGTVDFLGHNETIGSLTMQGGAFRTNSQGPNAVTINTVTIKGDANVTGGTNTTTADGFTANSNSTLIVNGTLRLSGLTHAVVGANNATLVLGGLEMTGTAINQNVDAAVNAESIVRLKGDTTTFASSFPALLGNSNDPETFLELSGTRAFNVADGPAGEDLLVSSVIRDDTSAPGAGGIIKNGPGIMEIRGGANTNTFTGPTTVNEGALVLFKSGGSNALGSGTVTVGDGIGGARADRLILRSRDQIDDAANLTVSASGVVDLDTFNTREQISSLAGSGFVDLGPNSTLTVSGFLSTVYSGIIGGGGGLDKGGSSTLELSGDNDYLGQTNVNEGVLIVKGSVGSVLVQPGATLSPGNGPALLNARGNFDLQAGATLKIELGGTTAGTGYDRINVAGGITLAGDLQGSLINGFTGSNDLFFILINDGADAVNGTFNGLTEGSVVSLSGKNFFITYQANFEALGGPSLTGGNDIALVVPEPSAGVSLLMGMSSLLGLKRFRRRQK